MQIIYDYDTPLDASVVIYHSIDTSATLTPEVVHPTLGNDPVRPIEYLKALVSGKIKIEGTGWDVITKHPSYPGKTRLQVCIAEIVRLNDTESRTILGV